LTLGIPATTARLAGTPQHRNRQISNTMQSLGLGQIRWRYVPAEVLASLGVTLDRISEHPRVAMQYLRTYQPPNTIAG
jgi:hypothetical protein